MLARVARLERALVELAGALDDLGPQPGDFEARRKAFLDIVDEIRGEPS